MMRQVAGAFAEYENTRLVEKLAAARWCEWSGEGLRAIHTTMAAHASLTKDRIPRTIRPGSKPGTKPTAGAVSILRMLPSKR